MFMYELILKRASDPCKQSAACHPFVLQKLMKPGSLKEMHNAYIMQLDVLTEFKNICSWPHNTFVIE